ncbi:MAG: helix-turn-helix domain-containing protein, partial [Acidobacteria bacterium]|nr:helix-turn-helix domain-containing protein [Acidobacteriota bacterium]
MHEKLHEEHGLQIKYSTLTRWLRQLGITQRARPRCERVPDEPGAEMQHDTTVSTLHLAGQPVRLVASLLYLRYSKRRYLRFYRSFDRFRMKCFLHRALMHWGYAPRRCIIDNTNLARLRGSGARALMVPEMEAFARQYGFQLEDLNEQAFQWATLRLEHRPQGKARLIPAKAFEHEQAFLTALAPHLPAPYQIHQRSIDEYGYVAFEANYYWIPPTERDPVRVLVYEDRLHLCQGAQSLIEYPLAPDGVRNQLFYPPGGPPPRHQPHNRRRASDEEEKRLRALDPSVGVYLDRCLEVPGLQRHVFVRRLLAFSQQINPQLFVRSVQRAHRYRIHQLDILERIAGLLLTQGGSEAPSIQL